MNAPSHILSAVFQATIVLAIVGLCWVGHRIIQKLRGQLPTDFASWSGLQRTHQSRNETLSLVLSGVVSGIIFGWLLFDPSSSVSQHNAHYDVANQPPLIAISLGLAYGYLKTGFSEELLFRGLIGKRFIAWFGFQIGNAIQALLFGILHYGIFRFLMPDSSWLVAVSALVLTTIVAWLAGWYMERRDEGSIMGPWLIHGSINFGVILMYVWLIHG